MRIISTSPNLEPQAIKAHIPADEALLKNHPAARLFNLYVVESSFQKVYLEAELQDLVCNTRGECKSALSLLVDMATRLVGADLIGPCELLEYEMHFHSGFTQESLSLSASIDSASAGYASCACAIYATGYPDDRLVASAQGTLVKRLPGDTMDRSRSR